MQISTAFLKHNMFDKPIMERLRMIKAVIMNSDAVINLSAATLHFLLSSSSIQPGLPAAFSCRDVDQTFPRDQK